MSVKMFSSRRVIECPSCGAGEDDICEDSGRNVCTSCGIILPGGSSVCKLIAHSESDNYRPVPHARQAETCPLVNILQERHPGCLNVATSLVNSMKGNITLAKGIQSRDRPRYAQALAYIAYKEDGQNVKLCDMARQIRVPVERMRKDIKKLAQRLKISEPGAAYPMDAKDCIEEEEMSEDVSQFKKSLLSIVRPWGEISAKDLRKINAWCTNVFESAIQSRNMEVLNAPPSNVAKAALSMYGERELRAPGKRKRDQMGGSDDGACSVGAYDQMVKLARVPPVRKLLVAMRTSSALA